MSSNNIYNILGKLKGISDTAALTPDTVEETVYESVEPRGSLSEAVKQIEAKYQTFKESAKPDFLDVDKDGDKAEPFKKAVKDKKAVEEGTIAKPQTDLKKHSATAKRMTMQKKADKDWNDSQAAKQATNEGQGPYELYNPKHPKFKANHNKWMKKNPGKKLADFIEAMKKKEATMNEAAYDEPEAPNADAIAKRKRLQALKDKQEDERAERGQDKPESNVRIHKGTYGNEYKGDADLDEVAPPGAKAEKLVKSIKAGYAKDGKLTKKEKGIAYATAWKAHNKGQVEEGVEFKDAGKIKNSAPEMKKAKLAKVTEGRVMEETDYFYEKIGKALAEQNPHLDTAKGEFITALRQEMVAQGIPPNRARNIIMMDDDFISDVATSYGHYCKDVAESGTPMNSHLGGVEELDEIARLAGLSAPTTELDELTAPPLATPGKTPSAKPTGIAPAKPGVPPTPTFNEEEVEEGNEFSGALAAAKAAGEKEFEVDGKKYTVKESQEQVDENISQLTIQADGMDALHIIQKLSGLESNPEEEQPQAVEVPQEANPVAMDVPAPEEEEVAEERDIEYVNTPNEKIGPVGSAIPSGDDMHRAKKSYSDKPYRGDNPMAVQESAEDSLWKKYSGMLKGLIK